MITEQWEGESIEITDQQRDLLNKMLENRRMIDPNPVTLTQDEYRQHQTLLQEKIVLEENVNALKKLIAEMVSSFRQFARENQDITDRLYTKASYFEDKARSI